MVVKSTKLRSNRIRDPATRTSLLVEDDQITVGTVDVDNILGSLNVENDTVGGEITADKLTVEQLISIRSMLHLLILIFQIIYWITMEKKGEATKQIVWRENRFYISSDIDLHRDATVKIDDIPVISADALGVTVQKSSSTSVGRLVNLQTDGDPNVDDFVLYDSGTMRSRIGVEAINAQSSVASNEAEFVVDRF